MTERVTGVIIVAHGDTYDYDRSTEIGNLELRAWS